MGDFLLWTPKTPQALGRKDGITDVLVPNNPNNWVDVVKDFPWTLSPKSSRLDVPYIKLIERKVKSDIFLIQSLYYLRTFAEVGSEKIEEIVASVDKATGGVLTDEQKNQIKQIKESSTSKFLQGDPSNPYKGLYDLEDTGWYYKMPYFDSQNFESSNSWGEDSGGTMVRDVVSAFMKSSENVIKDLNSITNNTGTYIEKPKFFKHSVDGPKYSFSFNLYNTVTIEDILRNWRFLYLLRYQNDPNRRTKALIDPPVLYEVEIPGVTLIPISYMSKLKVSFLGATRIMKLGVGVNEKLIDVVVPEAYKVEIELTSMFAESRNFINGIIDNSKKVIVSDPSAVDNGTVIEVTNEGNSSSNTASKAGGLMGVVQKIGNAINNYDKTSNQITIVDGKVIAGENVPSLGLFAKIKNAAAKLF